MINAPFISSVVGVLKASDAWQLVRVWGEVERAAAAIFSRASIPADAFRAVQVKANNGGWLRTLLFSRYGHRFAVAEREMRGTGLLRIPGEVAEEVVVLGLGGQGSSVSAAIFSRVADTDDLFARTAVRQRMPLPRYVQDALSNLVEEGPPR